MGGWGGEGEVGSSDISPPEKWGKSEVEWEWKCRLYHPHHPNPFWFVLLVGEITFILSWSGQQKQQQQQQKEYSWPRLLWIWIVGLWAGWNGILWVKSIRTEISLGIVLSFDSLCPRPLTVFKGNNFTFYFTKSFTSKWLTSILD